MLVGERNWFQVEDYLLHDDRAVLPIGCTEQHAYLSLATDTILASRIAEAAAEPLGVPVFPALAYGITPYFRAYPGTISLRVETMLCLVRDILDGLDAQGFRRMVIVNGHGGNGAVRDLAAEWMADHPRSAVKFHNWWNAPRTFAKVLEIDPVASHAIVDGEFSVDAGRWCGCTSGDAGRGETANRPDGRARSGRDAAIGGRWKFRWSLPARRCGDAGDLAGCRRGDAGVDYRGVAIGRAMRRAVRDRDRVVLSTHNDRLDGSGGQSRDVLVRRRAPGSSA